VRWQSCAVRRGSPQEPIKKVARQRAPTAGTRESGRSFTSQSRKISRHRQAADHRGQWQETDLTLHLSTTHRFSLLSSSLEPGRQSPAAKENKAGVRKFRIFGGEDVSMDGRGSQARPLIENRDSGTSSSKDNPSASTPVDNLAGVCTGGLSTNWQHANREP